MVERNVSLMSRERASGYDPALINALRVLVVGTGALGQNLCLNLALLQVGELWLCDFDQFSATNATRSPFFPRKRERVRWGIQKAYLVGRKLRHMTGWSKRPTVKFSCQPIQALADEPFRQAAIVFGAVDNHEARGHISDMCRRHGALLVEGGFDGADVSYAVFRNRKDDACWRCAAPATEGETVRFSCDRFAQQAKDSGYVAATQPAAAALAAMMVEAGMMAVHGERGRLNDRLYLNVRTGQSAIAKLAPNPRCPGNHETIGRVSAALQTTSACFADELTRELAKSIAAPQVTLPARFIAQAPCSGKDCGQVVQIDMPAWRLREQPRCSDCGGGFSTVKCKGLPLVVHNTLSEDTTDLHRFTCRALGIAAGAVLEVTDRSGKSMLVQMPGDVDDLFQTVSSIKESRDATDFPPPEYV